jgi:hypothetical protein
MRLNGRSGSASTDRGEGVTFLVIVLVVLAVISVAALWRRFGGTRADEHRIERHEHALDVLGETSRRGESTASVRIVPANDAAKIHIKPTEEGHSVVPRPSTEEVPPPRIRLEPPVLPGTPLSFGHHTGGVPAVPDRHAASGTAPMARSFETLPHAASRPARVPPASLGADEEGFEEEEVVALGPAAPAGSGRASSGRAGSEGLPEDDRSRSGLLPGAGMGPAMPGRRARERRVRLAAIVSMVVVAVAAVTVASIHLAGGGGKPGRASPTTSTPTTQTTTSPRGPGGSTTSTVVPTTTTQTPSTIDPQATSASDVSYVAPATTYTVTFTASGPCWIGVEHSTKGPWLWMDTLAGGQSQTYAASGDLVVRLGAPPYIKVAIDGITVDLPPSNVQPYDLTFTPSA